MKDFKKWKEFYNYFFKEGKKFSKDELEENINKVPDKIKEKESLYLKPICIKCKDDKGPFKVCPNSQVVCFKDCVKSPKPEPPVQTISWK